MIFFLNDYECDMIQQDKLFVFIQSLTPAEKAYFAKYSRLNATKEKPDYLLLFEFLSEANKYDEATIKKYFKGEKFIAQLARKKTQLKDKILESLSHYHANRTVESSLRLQMNLLPILYDKATKNKSLVKEFEHQIKAIKKKATVEGCFPILMDLFRWERQLLRLEDNNKQDDKVLSLLDSREQYQKLLNKERTLEDAALRTELIILKDPKIKQAANRQKFEDSVINAVANIKQEELSKLALRHYYYVKCCHSGYLNDWESAYSAAKNLIGTYSENDMNNDVVLKQYKQHLCRYLVVCGHAQKFDDYLERINEVKAISSEEDIRLFNTVHFKLLGYYLSKFQFNSAVKVVKDVERRWEDLCEIIPKRRQLAYCYNIMIAYWFGGNIETARYWLSKILNFENINQGQRYIILSRIIQLPIYYDTESDNLENRIESTRKVLAKKNELTPYRQIILSGFRRLVGCVTKQDKKDCFMDIQDKLTQIKDEQSIKAIDLDSILLWTKLKTEKGKIESIDM